MEKQVQSRIKKQIERNQKDYYLREQIKAIQTELGDKDGTDVEELREKLEKTPLNDEARQKAEKELERLSHMAPGTPEIGISRTYVEWILDLPWGKTTTDNLDLKRARRILDQVITGWKRSRSSIIEYLAVLRLKQDLKGRFCALSALRAWARPLSSGRWRRLSARESSRCRWAVCGTKPRFAVTGAPM